MAEQSPEDTRQTINSLSAGLIVSMSVAADVVVQMAVLDGVEWIDKLNARAVLAAKNAAIEGVAIEEDARMLGDALRYVDMIFATARQRYAKAVEQ